MKDARIDTARTRRARERTTVVAVFFGLTLAASATAWWAWGERTKAIEATMIADTERDKAEERLATTYFEMGSLEMKQGRPRTGVALLRAALRSDPRNKAARVRLLAALATTNWLVPAHEADLGMKVTDLVWSPNGTQLLFAVDTSTAQGDARKGSPDRQDWQIARIEPGIAFEPRSLLTEVPFSHDVEFSLNGKYLLETIPETDEESNHEYLKDSSAEQHRNIVRAYDSTNGQPAKLPVPAELTPVTVYKRTWSDDRRTMTLSRTDGDRTIEAKVSSKGEIFTAFVSLDGGYVLSAAQAVVGYEYNEQLIASNSETGQQLLFEEEAFSLRAAEFSPGGAFLALDRQHEGYDGNYYELFVRPTYDGAYQEWEFFRDSEDTRLIAMNPNGRYLAMLEIESASQFGGRLMIDELWDHTGAPLEDISGRKDCDYGWHLFFSWPRQDSGEPVHAFDDKGENFNRSLMLRTDNYESSFSKAIDSRMSVFENNLWGHGFGEDASLDDELQQVAAVLAGAEFRDGSVHAISRVDRRAARETLMAAADASVSGSITRWLLTPPEIRDPCVPVCPYGPCVLD